MRLTHVCWGVPISVSHLKGYKLLLAKQHELDNQ
jgi:hypothetical protein